jgi:hypothetical protein
MASNFCRRSLSLVKLSKLPASMTSFAMSIFCFWITLRIKLSMLSANMTCCPPAACRAAGCMLLPASAVPAAAAGAALGSLRRGWK